MIQRDGRLAVAVVGIGGLEGEAVGAEKTGGGGVDDSVAGVIADSVPSAGEVATP
jgi:hypothetical protein